MGTTDWMVKYQNSELTTLPRITSDHRPLKLKMTGWQKKNTPFKFEFMWMEHPSFKDNLKQWWNCNIKGRAMYRLSMKLKEVKRHLKKCNKEVSRNLEERKNEMELELEQIEDSNLQFGGAEDLEKKERTLADYYNTLAQKEIHWRKKSRVAWLNQRDRNTAFYNMTTFQRKEVNRITELKDQNGIMLHEEEDIKKEI